MRRASEAVYLSAVNFLLTVQGQMVAFGRLGELEETVAHLLPLISGFADLGQ